jgi:hypothetical protein
MKKKLRDISICIALCIFCIPYNSLATDVLLTEIRLGKHDDFSRIVFEFQSDVQYHLTPDHVTGHISIVFDGARTHVPIPGIDEDSVCIDTLGVSQQETNLIVDIGVSTPRFQMNPFTLLEPFRLVVDITCQTEVVEMDQQPLSDPATVIPEKPHDISSANIPEKKQEPDITMKDLVEATAETRQIPFDKTAGVQNYLIVLLAILSLIIIVLAGIILYQYRTSHEKSLQEDSTKKFERSEDMLSSIDKKIRKKLQAYKED